MTTGRLRTILGGALGCIAVLAAAACTDSVSGQGSLEAGPPTPTASPSVSLPTDYVLNCEYRPTGTSAVPGVERPREGQVRAKGKISFTVVTNLGDLDVTVDTEAAPCTINSLLSLADQGFYDGSACQRLSTEPDLRILQCGDPSGTGAGGPGYEFDDELNGIEYYSRGVLAMANPGPDANGSQFFVVYGDGADIDPSFTIFGEVSDASMSVIDAVAAAGVQGGGTDGVPVQSLIIESFAD